MVSSKGNTRVRKSRKEGSVKEGHISRGMNTTSSDHSLEKE